MTTAKSLNRDKLNEMFEYRDGILLYRKNPNRSVSRIGTRAGWVRPNGYRMVIVDGEEYREHRVIWAMHYGDIEAGQIVDHRDGNESNNTLSNLRAASETYNRLNQRMRKGRKGQYKGVCWDKSRNRWMARLKIGDTTYYIGRFDTAEEAAIAYDNKARELCPEYTTLNFPVAGERSAHTGDIV